MKVFLQMRLVDLGLRSTDKGVILGEVANEGAKTDDYAMRQSVVVDKKIFTTTGQGCDDGIWGSLQVTHEIVYYFLKLQAWPGWRADAASSDPGCLGI